jgi:hypothetical protein
MTGTDWYPTHLCVRVTVDDSKRIFPLARLRILPRPHMPEVVQRDGDMKGSAIFLTGYSSRLELSFQCVDKMPQSRNVDINGIPPHAC